MGVKGAAAGPAGKGGQGIPSYGEVTSLVTVRFILLIAEYRLTPGMDATISRAGSRADVKIVFGTLRLLAPAINAD
jgi:hypothetical protein